MLNSDGLATLLQYLAVFGIVAGFIGLMLYFYPRTPVGKASERYTDALEGENKVQAARIARLESDAATLRASLEEALRRVSTLEADISAVKSENDRLRAENTRMHDALALVGKDIP